ncbi:P-loop containing nucleoside triphosphate hydrolase protein, partial [Suillus weaverae]
QDTNAVQCEFMCCIAAASRCVSVVGNPDQSNTSRIAKTPCTDHPLGPLSMLRSFPTEHDEAAFIAWGINRMMAQSGGMLGFGDIAVLLRFNAISRTIENALQKEGIPNRMLGGYQFFDRAEVSDLLRVLLGHDTIAFYLD